VVFLIAMVVVMVVVVVAVVVAIAMDRSRFYGSKHKYVLAPVKNAHGIRICVSIYSME
jgi:ABC-type spermidine/putrescine transport system permease subunit II